LYAPFQETLLPCIKHASIRHPSAAASISEIAPIASANPEDVMGCGGFLEILAASGPKDLLCT